MSKMPLTPSNAALYSTSDWVPVGNVWIDGKPIHRKCFTGSTASGTSPGAITGSGNIDLIVNAGGCFNTQYGVMPMHATTNSVSASIYLAQGEGIYPRVLRNGGPIASTYAIWVEATLN